MAGSVAPSLSPRILHLLDPLICGDESLLACAAAIHALPYFSHHAWLIGSSAHERTCWSLGILTTDRVAPRAESPRLPFRPGGVIPSLARLRAARARAGNPPPDLIQCWSLSTLHIARQIFGDGHNAPPRCAVIPNIPLTAPQSVAPDSDLATGREVIAAFNADTRLALAPLISRAGHAEAHRWLPTIRLLAPPAFAPGGPIPTDRSALRASLNLEPTDLVVGLLADPPSRADAQRLMFAMGVLNALGHRTVSLIRRGASQDRRAAAYLHAHARRWGLVVADLPLHSLLAASDLCILDAPPDPRAGSPTPAAGPIAASLALSMGVPIFTFPGLLSHWPVLAARSATLGAISEPIRAFLENPTLPPEHAASVRGWCEQLRASRAFESTLGAIWAEQLNLPSSALAGQYVR